MQYTPSLTCSFIHLPKTLTERPEVVMMVVERLDHAVEVGRRRQDDKDVEDLVG